MTQVVSSPRAQIKERSEEPGQQVLWFPLLHLATAAAFGLFHTLMERQTSKGWLELYKLFVKFPKTEK